MGPRSFIQQFRWTRVAPFLAFLIVIALSACSEQDVLLPAASGHQSIVIDNPAMCGATFSTPLIAGQKFTAGTVTVTNDETKLYVTLATAGGWTLVQSHVAVAQTRAGIPVNRPGNPEPGQFPYSASHGGGTTSHTYVVPRDALAEGQPFFVAAQADVKLGSQAEGAWGQGTPFVAKGNWAMFFTVSLNPCQGVVKGRVVDAETQAVLGGATVTLTDNGQRITGEDGTFVFDPVHIGSYSAHVTRTAFHPADVAMVAVTKNTTTDVGDIPLRPMKGLIAGRVIDAGNSQPIAGAAINITQGGVVLQTLSTAADGTFTTEALRIGAYDLMITDALHHPKLAEGIAVTVDATTAAGDLPMRPLTGEVTGRVTDMFTHGPLAGVAVVMTAGANTYTATTNAEGGYGLVDVRIGSYAMTFRLDDFDPAAIAGIEVGAGQSVPVGITELRPFTGMFAARVIDAQTRLPLANATVEVFANGAPAATVHTDAGGRAEVELRIGQYAAKASAPLFHASNPAPFAVTHATTTAVEFNLQPQQGRISGAVTDQFTGAGIDHANVLLRSLPTNQVVLQAYTAGPEGRFEFPAVRVGEYALEFSASNYDPKTITPIRVESGGNEQYSAQLRPWTGFLVGQVKDAELGTPIAGATVTFATSSGTVITTKITGADGTTEPVEVRLGQYRMNATAPNFHSSPTMLPGVGHGATSNVTLTLAPHTGTITGRVVDQFSRNALAGVTITVRKVPDNSVVREVVTQPGGGFALGGLRVGQYTLDFAAPNYDDGRITPVTVALTPPTSLGDVSLRPWTGYLQVRATDAATGAPIVGATVRVFLGSTQVGSWTTQPPNGATPEAELVLGSYEVDVSAPGYVTSSRVSGTVTHDNHGVAQVALQLAVGGIAGVLRDSETNAPIAGGTVQVINGATVVQAMTTAADGAFNFANVPVGSYRVHFEAPNYNPRDYTPVTVPQGATNNLGAVTLTPQKGYLAFQVRQAVTTTPIPGATVQVFLNGTQVASGTSAAPYGQIEFNLRVGTYTARVTAAGHVTQDVPAMQVTNAGTTSREVLLVPANGTVQGLVVNATNSSPLVGATVQVLVGTTVVTSTTTGSTGAFGPLTLDPGSYTVRASASGFVPASATVTVTAGGTHNIGTLSLSVANGAAQGTVTNATTGAGLSGATVEFLSGTTVITSVVTGSGGAFGPVSLAPGSYTARASLTGFSTASTPVTVNAGATTYTGVIALSPVMPEGQVRVTLTWGSQPTDLDSHLTGPNSSGGRFHVYYAHLSDSGATLDHDDVSSYGPETITFTQNYAGAYRYSVHNYSRQVPLTSSQGVVTVYRGSTQIAQYTVPTSGTGTIWTVFELDGSTLTTLNTIGSGPYLMAEGSTPSLRDDAALIGNAIRSNPKR